MKSTIYVIKYLPKGSKKTSIILPLTDNSFNFSTHNLADASSVKTIFAKPKCFLVIGW